MLLEYIITVYLHMTIISRQFKVICVYIFTRKLMYRISIGEKKGIMISVFDAIEVPIYKHLGNSVHK